MTSKPRLPDPGYGRWWRIYEYDKDLYIGLMEPHGYCVQSNILPHNPTDTEVILLANDLLLKQDTTRRLVGEYKYDNGELVDLHG